MILDVPMGVLINVRIIEKHLIVFHPRERITDLSLPRAKRFYLGPVQDDPGLKGLQYMKITARFRIAQDIGHNNNSAARTESKVYKIADSPQRSNSSMPSGPN